MDMVVKDSEKHKELVAKLMTAKSTTWEREIIDQMSLIEKDDKYLAFEQKVDQHAWIMASSFSDSWTLVKDAAGRVIGGICSYYPCLGCTRWAGGPSANAGVKQWAPDACCRVIPSKDWRRSNADPLAPRQRYYCYDDCGKKFQAGWGQLVEVKRMNPQGVMEVFYMRAEVPSWDVEDIRAMHIQDTLADGCNTAMDLFNKIHTVKPALSALVVPDPTIQGVVTMTSRAAFDALPFFSWWEIFTFQGVQPPKGVKAPAGLR